VVEVKHYRATARRSGGWWAFEVRGVPGAFGQARRLEQVEGAAREVAAMMLEVDEDGVAVELEPLLEDDLAAHVDEARRRKAKAELAAALAVLGAVVAVHQLRKAGLPDRDTADLLGISHQRVSQLAQADEKQLRARVRQLELAAA
jgi:DNA-directed RNA polymerase specialized sigma subunit